MEDLRKRNWALEYPYDSSKGNLSIVGSLLFLGVLISIADLDLKFRADKALL